MANKVAELYADFRVNFAKATLDVANTALGELRLGTIAEIASLAGLTRMLYNVGDHALKTATHLHMLAATYGINTQQLQHMEKAGLAANVSVDKMESSVLGLQNNLAALNLGQVNAGFLEAAGFFGLGVGPGTSADQMMDQLFKKVPSFVKAHGAMGKAMASTLLSQMGIAPEMMQYIMTGKKTAGGPVIKDPTIEALTKTSESLSGLSFDVQNLGTEAISPLVEILGPISEYLQTIASVAGGVDNLAHPFRTAEGLGAAFMGKVHEMSYVSRDQQKMMAAEHLARHRGQVPFSPVVSASLHPGVVAAMVGAGGRSGGNSHSETNISVYGVEDHKIAGAVKRAAAQAHERTKRDYAMHTAINNPVGQ